MLLDKSKSTPQPISTEPVKKKIKVIDIEPKQSSTKTQPKTQRKVYDASMDVDIFASAMKPDVIKPSKPKALNPIVPVRPERPIAQTPTSATGKRSVDSLDGEGLKQKKKRVSWRSDKELCEIRYIDSENPPSSHHRSMKDGREDSRKEGMALKEKVAEEKEWTVPRPLIQRVKREIESTESQRQRQREKTSFMQMYMNVADTPPSATEPDQPGSWTEMDDVSVKKINLAFSAVTAPTMSIPLPLTVAPPVGAPAPSVQPMSVDAMNYWLQQLLPGQTAAAPRPPPAFQPIYQPPPPHPYNNAPVYQQQNTAAFGAPNLYATPQQQQRQQQYPYGPRPPTYR
jgi:hypothetical protein